MKKAFCSVFILLFSILFYSSCSKSAGNKLAAYAKEIKTELPQKMDDITYMTDIECVEDTILKYTYTLTIPLDLSTISLKSMENETKKILIENVKGNTYYSFFSENKVHFWHHYVDSEKRDIIDIHITSKEY